MRTRFGHLSGAVESLDIIDRYRDHCDNLDSLQTANKPMEFQG